MHKLQIITQATTKKIKKKGESMNQIIVTEKIYVTPELRRKKKIYKIQFALSVFFMILLFSYYIYAEYERDKSEQVSQDILTSIAQTKGDVIDNTVTNSEILVVTIEAENETLPVTPVIQEPQADGLGVYTAEDGRQYKTESILNIPVLDLSYPVLSEQSEELLKISLNKYWGPAPNEVGNYCIVGHNYRSGKMFGNLSKIKNGDKVELTDATGRTLTYSVYNKFIVEPTDTDCTSQITNGYKELTLITCTNQGKQRLVVKCRAI